jgi:hypothetical protein
MNLKELRSRYNIRKKEGKFVKKGLLEDLVGCDYCDPDELEEIKESFERHTMAFGNIQVVFRDNLTSENNYFLTQLDKQTYLVAGCPEHYEPSIVQFPIYRIDEVDWDKDEMVMEEIKSPELAQKFYDLLEEEITTERIQNFDRKLIEE